MNMEPMKRRLGILLVILCMALLAGVVWYCMFGRKPDDFTEGTLVEVSDAAWQDGGGQII